MFFEHIAHKFNTKGGPKMGGKNHQPCREYLVNSTKLSRFISLAYISLEKANVFLEDLLLAELNDGQNFGIWSILEEMKNSSKFLHEAERISKNLWDQMITKNYSDPDVLCSVDLNTVGEKLCSKGLVTHNAWTKIGELTYEQGFYSVLEYFQKQIDDLLQKTEVLIQKVLALESIANTSQINLVLEENTDANIKVEFFQLYTAWCKFNSEFIASSVLSTELWYLNNNYGSLLCPESALSKVA